MRIKDYYEILEIHPDASEAEIKRAYRKLAMRFHPDKNVGNPYAIHHFREIQEAYEVLSNPSKRNEYHYQRQVFGQNGKRSFRYQPVTPMQLLKEARQIATHVQQVDIFRMNHEALNNQVLQLLNEPHIKILAEQNEEKTNAAIIQAILKAIAPLHYQFIPAIAQRLVRIAAANNDLILQIDKEVKRKARQYYWDKYHPLVIALLVALLCLLIYRMA
ncbi:DnaJ domain-containing protein [Flavihumibacter rivuli]|uniref:DnaJ domain-containing protein n=1 Tax=Flavihumibacter rivuli TaxID=2838156 RepID=UPI001BDDE863|nr:DnaJ domain-containing protein [Flavihumibacter rivuli]ULQ57327.1 DnaJ domain-containing protein [Flavihumibacter rivuli]